MSKSRDLAHLDVFDAPWTDAIQEAISVAAPNLRLAIVNATTIRAVGGTVNDQAVAFVGGLWRWRTTNQDITPSGGAGVFEIWIAASANENVSATVDNTDYNYYLYVRATGSGPPTGNTPAAKAITQTRKIGELDWSGTAITGIRQWVGVWDSRDPITPTQPLASIPALRVRGIASSSGNVLQLEDSAGVVKFGVTAAGIVTVASDLAVSGSATFAVSINHNGTFINLASGSIVQWNADTNLYRAGASILKTDDAFQTVGDITVLAGAAFRAQQSAANSIIANKLLAGDANDSFRIVGNGQLVWGLGGANVVDVNLYRGGVDVLQTDDFFAATRGSSSANSFGATVTGDANYRFVIDASGKMSWGPSTTGADTNLYRRGVDQLGTDDTIVVTRATGTDLTFFTVRNDAPAFAAFSMNAAGTLSWGSGSLTADTNLYRLAADTLKTDDALVVGLYVDSRSGLAGQIRLSDSNANGTGLPTIYFGTAFDTNLYRSAANTLTTDDTFVAGIAINTPGNVVVTGDGALVLRNKTGAGGAVLVSKILADTTDRFQIQTDGVLSWGSGGVAALDTNLSRSGVNTLRASGTFEVQGSLNLNGTFFNMLDLGVQNFGANGKVKGLAGGLALHSADDGQKFAVTNTGISFFGAAAAARVATRTFTNWTGGANTLRAIDRSNWTLQELFDYVQTGFNDLKTYGLFA